MNQRMQPIQAFFGLLTVLLVAIAGCQQKPEARLPLLFDNDVILAFGDSLTYGTGADARTSYPAVLSRLSARTVVNAGVPGETTKGGLARLENTLDKHQPALVLLCLGGNDFLRKVDEASTRQNLERMLGILKARGIPVVMLAVPGFGLSLSPHPLYRELAEKHSVILAEDLLSDILSDRDLKSDPIHPNAQGYSKMATSLLEVLRSRGAL